MIKEYRDLKILGVVWVSGPQLPTGMVMVENAVGVRKVYVGPGAGHKEDDDIRSICEWGDKLQPLSVEKLFKHFGGEINLEEDWLSVVRKVSHDEYPEIAGKRVTGSRVAQLIEIELAKVRQARIEATGDREQPQEHPSKTSENIVPLGHCTNCQHSDEHGRERMNLECQSMAPCNSCERPRMSNFKELP